MASVVNPVVSKVTVSFTDSVWRQFGYVWNYSGNIQSLKDQLQKLKGERQILLHRVDEAIRNGEEIEDAVKNWLAHVDESIKSADKILEQNDAANKRCFMGWCPNLKTRYQLSRQSKKQTPLVDGVRGEGKFDRISYRTDLQGVGLTKVFEPFGSRMLVLEEIMEALTNADVYMIGVYGMGGVGKTTLAKKVAHQVKEDGIFKAMAMATVTHIPDVKGIQQEIADWLDYKIDVESVHVRAVRLGERLKREERILIILDDIWMRIKLEEIGIPFGNDHKGCKILLTSRSQNVLWEMGVHRDFGLQVLPDEEAWQLFERTVGYVEDPNLQPIANQVARRCAGLPVLLVTVATALKNKELFEWNDALEGLKRFDSEEIEVCMYSALELSYKFLGGEQQSLFLLIGQLRPHFVFIRDVLKYSMGLGLFNQRATVKAARNRLLKLINDLKKSCLLLEGIRNERVKMHDVVHSFAASLASKHYHVFNLPYHTELEEWPAKDTFEQCTAISLPYCRLPNFPEVLECPKLKSLLLFNKDRSLKIPENFFIRMKELKVLDLTKMDLSPLPSSLQCLENLQTLCLDFCILEDIAIVGELKKLQVLSLIGSTIVELPREVGKLTRLRILDLSRCKKLQVIPPDVLSCLTQLEELRMGNNFVQWEGEGHHGLGNNANLSELKLLLNLITLEIHIKDASILPKSLFSEKLERFKIFIGGEWDWSGKHESSRTLKLKLNISSQLEEVRVLLKGTEDLYLEELKGAKNILYELDQQGFHELKHLHVQNNPEIQYIVESIRLGPEVAFPMLESLFLNSLINLEKICHGPLQADSFRSLRKVNVRSCNRLKNLFSFSMARALANLEEINVSSCQIMQETVAEEIRDDFGEDETIELTKLCTMTLESLPHFRSFSFQSKASSLTPLPLFNKEITFPSLADLKLSSVCVEKIWCKEVAEVSTHVQKLTTLVVNGCRKLIYLFEPFMVGSLAQLRSLEISDCKSMKEIIAAQRSGNKAETKTKILFPKLDFLKLKGLPKLTSFCSGDLIECPSLKVLQIERCHQLKKFISNYATTDAAPNSESGQANSTPFDDKVAFPDLEELHIMYMPELKMIWHTEIQETSFSKLKVLKVKHCKKLLKILPSEPVWRFENLELLAIENCDSVEQVFDLQVVIKARQTHDVAVASQLRALDIRNLPNLKRVWNADPQGILSFDKLNSVVIWKCPSLSSLFPASIAGNLTRLEKLNIDNCGVEDIVSKVEELEATPKFVFPRLKSLVLSRLQKLKSFYPGTHALECPMLKSWSIYQCDSLVIFY